MPPPPNVPLRSLNPNLANSINLQLEKSAIQRQNLINQEKQARDKAEIREIEVDAHHRNNML